MVNARLELISHFNHPKTSDVSEHFAFWTAVSKDAALDAPPPPPSQGHGGRQDDPMNQRHATSDLSLAFRFLNRRQQGRDGERHPPPHGRCQVGAEDIARRTAALDALGTGVQYGVAEGPQVGVQVLLREGQLADAGLEVCRLVSPAPFSCSVRSVRGGC